MPFFDGFEIHPNYGFMGFENGQFLNKLDPKPRIRK